MADRKISDLTALTTPASGDYLPIVDISEAAAASKNKRITIEELMRGVPDGTAAAPGIAFETDPNTGIYSPGADQLAVATNGTGRLFVDASGRVGLGISTPNYELHLNASDATSFIQLTNSGTGTGASDGLLLYNNGVNATVSNQEAGYLAFETSGLDRLRITSAGLVGIGTSSVSTKLEIAGSNDAVTENNTLRFTDTDASTEANQQIGKIEFYSSDASTPGAGVKAYIGAFAADTTPDAYLAFATQDGSVVSTPVERVRITSDGKLGIGSTTPEAQLHIAANDDNAFNAGIRVARTTIPGQYVNLSYSNGLATLTAVDTVTSVPGFKFQTSTNGSTLTERVRIDTSNRLLIGTSTARSNFFNGSISAALQLEGTGTARRMSITGNDANPVFVLAREKSGSVGGNTIVANNDILGTISFQGSDGTEFVSGAEIIAEVDGTPGANDLPTRLVFSTTSDSASSPTERMRITSAGVLQIADAGNITVGTTTGTKIGTATTQKLGFYNATPVVQPAAVADATDAASGLARLNDLLARLRTLGIIAT